MLTLNQKKALVALLSNSTIETAAQSCGLNRWTVHKYLRKEEFTIELQSLQDRTINAATAALSGLSGEAIGLLSTVIKDTDAPISVRVRAALGVLDHTQKMISFADLEKRISKLEGIVNDI